MAKEKRSFVLYCDWIHTVKELTDEEAGKLMKHLLAYVNDENPEINDRIIKIAFEPIKNQLKRDLKKYERIKKKRTTIGKIGGINSGKSRQYNTDKSKQIEANEAIASKSKQIEANEAVNVNGNVNVNDIDIYSASKPKKNSLFIYPNKTYKLSLSELDVGRAIEYLTRTKHVVVSDKTVEAIWAAFITENFTGDKPYRSDSEIISHFFKSLKYQKIEQQIKNLEILNGSSTEKYKAAKQKIKSGE